MKNTWDNYFLNICSAVTENSKCYSRKIGAVLVRDKYIISTGYNGPPKGFPHCCTEDSPTFADWMRNDPMFPTCPRKLLGYTSSNGGTKQIDPLKAGLHLCPAAHAERNAIDIAAQLGHPTQGCTLYLNCPLPCRECAKSIVNAGITEVVVTEMRTYENSGITGEDILRLSGIVTRCYSAR